MICAAVPAAVIRATRRATTAVTTAPEGVPDHAPGVVAVPVVVDARATATVAKEDCGVFRVMGAVDAEDVADAGDAAQIVRTHARAALPAVPTATQTET